MIIVFLISSFNTLSYAASKENSYSDKFSNLPLNIQHLYAEDFEEDSSLEFFYGRTNYEIVKRTINGNYSVDVYGVPIKYEDENGEINYVDTSIKERDLLTRAFSKYNYENAGNIFDVYFADTAEKGININDDFTFSSNHTSDSKYNPLIGIDENADGKIIYKNAFGENTALEYVNINTGIKENLILYKNIGINEFEFIFSSNTHTPILAKDDKCVSVINNVTGEIDYHFLPLYAYDSYEGDKYSSVNKHNTEDNYYKVTVIDNNKYLITSVISKDFLENPETVYPVTIDPTVYATQSTVNIADTYVSAGSPNANYGSGVAVRIGYYGYHTSTAHKMRTYVKFISLPSGFQSSQITSAYLRMNIYSGTSTAQNAKVQQVTYGDWSESGLTWNNQPSVDSIVVTSGHNNCSYYNFDVTDIVKLWYIGYPNYGVMVSYENESYNDYNNMYSVEGSVALAPKLSINYASINKTTYVTNGQDVNNSPYNRSAAAEYAYTYGDDLRDGLYDTPNYLSTVAAPSNLFGLLGNGADCTNFVSQCLKAGGMYELQGGQSDVSAWYYANAGIVYNASYTWGSATNFAKHWGIDLSGGTSNRRAYKTIVYNTPQDVLYDWDYLYSVLSEGDIIQYASTNTSVEHSMIIHEKNAGEIFYAQHTSSKINQNLYTLLNEKNSASPNHKWIFHIIK